MRYVKFLNNYVDPATFKVRGFGVSGYFFYLVNVLRMWCEYLILLYVARSDGRQGAEIKVVLRKEAFGIPEPEEPPALRPGQSLLDDALSRAEQRGQYSRALQGPPQSIKDSGAIEQRVIKFAVIGGNREGRYRYGPSKVFVYEAGDDGDDSQ